MIEKEGLIYKQHGKRTILLRDVSYERLQCGYERANFMGTGLALVGITKPYESPLALIERINAMRTFFSREANAAVSMHNKTRNETYKKQILCSIKKK